LKITDNNNAKKESKQCKYDIAKHIMNREKHTVTDDKVINH